MGNHNLKLSECVHIVANSDTWIEGKAIQQLEKTAQLPGIIRAAGMPDLHPGRGYPIGAVFLTTNIIYPALVGNDIGCGMSLWQTKIPLKKINHDRFEKQIGSIDHCLDDCWQSLVDDMLLEKGADPKGFKASLGTIGGGNHFAELQQVEEIIDGEEFVKAGLDKKSLQLLVHSGSRGMGQSILRAHIDEYNHQGLKASEAAFGRYLELHDNALRFAECNRALIALRLLEKLKSTGKQVLDVNHNLVSGVKVNGQMGWLHRKGATPADQGLVMIPGSRGDFSYLVRPRFKALSLETEVPKDLLSLAHGAGRKWVRSDCKDRLRQKYRMEQLIKTKLGSLVICSDRSLIYEEAPEAYKPNSNGIDAMVKEQLIDVVAVFKPVLTYKTKGGC